MKKTLEQEINAFLELWDVDMQVGFLEDLIPLFHLYNVDKDDDWVKNAVGGDDTNVATVRLLRTVYIISKIAEHYAGRLCNININFKNLWKKMEQEGVAK